MLALEQGAALALLELVDYAALGQPAPVASVRPAAVDNHPSAQPASPASTAVEQVVAAVTVATTTTTAAAALDAANDAAREQVTADSGAAPPVAAPVPALAGTLNFYQAGELLIVEDSAPAQAQANSELLRKILAAARRAPLAGAPESITWPLPGAPDGSLRDARDYTEAYLTSRRHRLPFSEIWLMGELPWACVGASEREYGAVVGQSTKYQERIWVRILPSLQSMQTNQAAKSSCWRALKKIYDLN